MEQFSNHYFVINNTYGSITAIVFQRTASFIGRNANNSQIFSTSQKDSNSKEQSRNSHKKSGNYSL